MALEGVLEEVDSFMLEGHDATAMGKEYSKHQSFDKNPAQYIWSCLLKRRRCENAIYRYIKSLMFFLLILQLFKILQHEYPRHYTLSPVIQAKVHQELGDIFGDDLQRSMTHEDLHNMKYT